MLVLDRRIGGGRAAFGARHDDRDLAAEIDEGLENPDIGAHSRPRGLEIGVGADQDLALAVVAEPHRLQHRERADVAHRAPQRGDAPHLAVIRRRDVDRAEEILLPEPVLGDAQDRGEGWTGRPAATSVSAASAGMFSNSKVMTSTAAAKRPRASRSV